MGMSRKTDKNNTTTRNELRTTIYDNENDETRKSGKRQSTKNSLRDFVPSVTLVTPADDTMVFFFFQYLFAINFKIIY